MKSGGYCFYIWWTLLIYFFRQRHQKTMQFTLLLSLMITIMSSDVFTQVLALSQRCILWCTCPDWWSSELFMAVKFRFYRLACMQVWATCLPMDYALWSKTFVFQTTITFKGKFCEYSVFSFHEASIIPVLPEFEYRGNSRTGAQFGSWSRSEVLCS